MLPLLKGDAGIGTHVLHRHEPATGQGVLRRDEQLRLHPLQLCEFQAQLAEHPPQESLVILIQRQNAHLAAQLAHILQHLIGSGLPKMEAVPGPPKILHQPGKGQHRKVKVLAGHSKALLPLLPTAEPLLQQLGLGEDLPGVAQEFLPLP